MPPEKTSHSDASTAYGLTQKELSQRSLEAHVLLKSALMLEQLATRLHSGENIPYKEIHETLKHNQKIWVLFANEMKDPENPLPLEIKNNIASLAVFVFKRTVQLMAGPASEKIRALININRTIASGLITQAENATRQETSGLPEDAAANHLA